MTRRKGNLWLHPPKRKSFSTPSKMTPKRIKILSTPKKRTCSPNVKVNTPKRHRNNRETVVRTDYEYVDVLSIDAETQTDNIVLDSKNICRNTFHDLFESAMISLNKNDKVKAKDFTTFLQLIKDNAFPLDNISFILFLETVSFLSMETSSSMRYSTASKRFWKIGYKLFHTKFLLFMGGPRNIGQVRDKTFDIGFVSPKSSSINFAVPSVSTIREFNITEFEIPSKLDTGVIHPILEALKLSGQNEFMLCADAKKVTAGVDKNGGDVDMFCHEVEPTLKDRKEALTRDLQFVENIKDQYKVDGDPDSTLKDIEEVKKVRLKEDLVTVSQKVSSRIREARDLQRKQTFGLKKFKAISGENWRESKYIYAISSLQASLYQLREFVRGALDNVTSISRLATSLDSNNLVSGITGGDIVDASFQNNMLRLVDVTEELENIDSRFVKQRTKLWGDLRKAARVTGSTLHTAIGLRGRKQQKGHLDKVMLGIDPVIPPDVQTRMDHGTINEDNAIATLVGRFMPVFYPDAYYVEEGCYMLGGGNVDVLGEVSPDGSIRKVTLNTKGEPINLNEVITAVEIKCPFPNENQLPVHYSLPDYYVCQCLAEMFVLDTDTLIYVSYSSESTTFFKVVFSNELWEVIWKEVLDIYDNESPTIPYKAKPEIKTIREKIKQFVENNVTFLGEFESVKLENSGIAQRCASLPFLFAWPIPSTDCNNYALEDLMIILESCQKIIETGYLLLRKKATEVMVWVLTNKDRNSKLEIPCSLPIAYGLKDYKLTAAALRNATNEVLKECTSKGIHVRSFATDGQWIQLMTRDSNNQPMTVYQLQRDLWNEVLKITKSGLINLISKLNIGNIVQSKDDNGILNVTSTDNVFEKMRTTRNTNAWQTKSNINSRVLDVHCEGEENASLCTDWLPDDIIQSLQVNPDEDIQNVVSLMSASFDNNEAEKGNESDTIDLGIMQMLHQDQENESDRDERRSTMSITDIENVDLSQKDTIHCVSGYAEDTFVLDHLLQCLKISDTTKQKWINLSQNDLFLKLRSRDHIETLTHVELNCICENLRRILPTTLPGIKISWKKKDKVELLSAMLGHIVMQKMIESKKKRVKSVSSLSKLCINVLKSKKYPKAVLNISYSEYLYPNRLEAWQEKATIDKNVKVEGFEDAIPFWYSYPEMNSQTGELLSKSIDCSHNLTHLRVRSCTTGIAGVPSDAWKECAKSNATPLTLAFVEDLIDKQSVPNARTNFSKEVEDWMFEHGYSESAVLTSIVRNWYEASDAPAMTAIDRIEKLLDMRSFLLKDVDFGKFPPPGRYIKSIPIVTFEGMLIDIDTKLQMYGITGPYNIRSIGSLAAETTVGILQALNPVSQVSIKARDVASLMASVAEVMTCKMNPDRGFFMRTSISSGIYPVHEGDSTLFEPDKSQETNRLTAITSDIIPRNHPFDQPIRKKVARKIKFGSISKPYEPARGALPVRQWHRKDESKILATKRLGITCDDI